MSGLISKVFEMLAAGGAVLPFILGLVEFFKRLGVTGKVSLGLSMGLGLIFGLCMWFASYGAPADFASWLLVVLFGLGMGLTASGIYDFVNKRFPKLE